MGFTSVRTWVFSGWGGTTMDADGNITGLTPEFIANLTDYLDLIKEKGLAVNLVLVPHIVQDVPSVEDQTIAMKTVLDETARESYINNALIPTIRALQNYQDCIVAIDLYCEPEGDAEDTAGVDDTNYPGRTALLSDITPFINAQAMAVKSILPNIKCIVSSAYNQNWQNYVTYADYDIDILGFDIYKDNSDVVIPENRIDSIVAEKFADRWITECNYYSDKNTVASWTEENFSDIIRNFYNNAKATGYSACYMWHYAASYNQKTSLVEGKSNNSEEPDLSKLRLSAQLLHYDIIDYNNSIGKTSGNDIPALLINDDNTCLRWIGSRQAAYYQIEYKNNSGWQLLETVQHVFDTNLYEYTLNTDFAIGIYPIRVVSYTADGNRRISNVIN